MTHRVHMKCRLDGASYGKNKCVAAHKLNEGSSAHTRAYLSQFYGIPIENIAPASSYDDGYQYSFATAILIVF